MFIVLDTTKDRWNPLFLGAFASESLALQSIALSYCNERVQVNKELASNGWHVQVIHEEKFRPADGSKLVHLFFVKEEPIHESIQHL